MAANNVGMDSTASFQRCCKKLMEFRFKDDEGTKANLHLLLGELIALDFNTLRIKNDQGNSLLKKLCLMVPLKHEHLVTKVCHVIYNFIKFKQVHPVFGDTAQALSDFHVRALQCCAGWVATDVLRSLATLLDSSWDSILQHQDLLVSERGILISMVSATKPDVEQLTEATHCLKCLALGTTDRVGLSASNATVCFTTLLTLLCHLPALELPPGMQCKVTAGALSGLQSLLVNAKVDSEPNLGQLLAVVKGYMFYGMGQKVVIPPEFCPTQIPGYEPKIEKPAVTASAAQIASSRARNSKSRKKKTGSGEEAFREEEVEGDTATDERLSSDLETLALQPAWARGTSSDSEFSDSELGAGSRGHAQSTKVRIAALSCLAAVCKLVDKRSLFAYWPYFIPDSAAAGSSPSSQSLLTSIMKDPSPKCRMGALVSLAAMLDGTKQFLAAAEESNMRTAFTPLSSLLGAMVRELHRCLLQALVLENYNLTLTQLIKCLATLLVNVPYHRLQPGLLTRVVKQIRHFFSHRDSNVRVACLTCLGALVSHQPPLMEVLHIIQSPTPPVGLTSASVARSLASMPVALNLDSVGLDTQSTPSLAPGLPTDTPATGSYVTGAEASEPGTPTPGSLSGIQTPVFTDQMLQTQAHEMSWLVKLCVHNILPHAVRPGGSRLDGAKGDDPGSEPLPVRLESLQVLATLTKGYFPVVRKQLGLMQELIHRCLENPDPTIKLHGCKVLEELATVMTKDIQDANAAPTPPPYALSVQQVLSVWQSVLEGPLMAILQDSQSSNPVRASVCDCMANIGSDIFILLSEDLQQQCLCLILDLTHSADRLVVSSAVRALGILVLYPCLSQNVSFMADSANAILKGLTMPSINVKIKSAWALGNLCDALVVNKENGRQQFMDEFSDLLLSTMLNAATQATQDSDKVKCNAVRAVGNILRYLTPRSLSKSHTVEAVANSVQVLVKTLTSGPMKVRWNTCYALANMLRNPLLLSGDTPWLVTVLTALGKVVKDCKNFKVRINAALALSVPGQREHYGDVTLYVFLWDRLIQSLQASDNITDFAEYRYRDSLTEKVCSALLHMLSLSEASDIVALLPWLQTDGQSLHDHMERFLASKTTAKVMLVMQARERLAALLSLEPAVVEDCATGIQLLHELCLLQTDEKGVHVSSQPASAFRQIYD